MKKMIAAIIATAMLIPSFVAAEEKLMCPKCKGWLWTDTPPMPKAEEKKQDDLNLPKPTIPPPLQSRFSEEDLMKMHPKPFQYLYTLYLEKAVGEPTNQNVTDVYAMQKVGIEKGLAYGNTAMAVVTSAPNLSMEGDIPVNAEAQNVKRHVERDEIKRKIDAEKEHWLLYYLKAESCVYCKTQDGANEQLYIDTGFPIKQVDVDVYYEYVKKVLALAGVNVQEREQIRTPMMLLGYVEQAGIPLKLRVVAVGAQSADELATRIYRSMRLLSGEITVQQWSMLGFQRGCPQDPSAYKRGAKREE